MVEQKDSEPKESLGERVARITGKKVKVTIRKGGSSVVEEFTVSKKGKRSKSRFKDTGVVKGSPKEKALMEDKKQPIMQSGSAFVPLRQAGMMNIAEVPLRSQKDFISPRESTSALVSSQFDIFKNEPKDSPSKLKQLSESAIDIAESIKDVTQDTISGTRAFASLAFPKIGPVEERARQLERGEEAITSLQKDIAKTTRTEFLDIKQDDSALVETAKTLGQFAAGVTIQLPTTLARVPLTAEKAGLQFQARLFGTPEQKEEARFLKKSEQSEAFFRSISPIRTKEALPQLESGLNISESPSLASVLAPVLKDVPQGVEFNPQGTINLAVAGGLAAVSAAPTLKRPTQPFANIRGDAKVTVRSTTTPAGRTTTTTQFDFTQQSPTISGFFGRGAQTKIVVGDKGGFVRTTQIGKKTFELAQQPRAGPTTLRVLRGGQVTSKTQFPRTELSGTSLQLGGLSQPSKPVVLIEGQKQTALTSSSGTLPLKIPTGSGVRLEGRIDFNVLQKQITDLSTGSVVDFQNVIGTGTLSTKTVLGDTAAAVKGGSIAAFDFGKQTAVKAGSKLPRVKGKRAQSGATGQFTGGFGQDFAGRQQIVDIPRIQPVSPAISRPQPIGIQLPSIQSRLFGVGPLPLLSQIPTIQPDTKDLTEPSTLIPIKTELDSPVDTGPTSPFESTTFIESPTQPIIDTVTIVDQPSKIIEDVVESVPVSQSISAFDFQTPQPSKPRQSKFPGLIIPFEFPSGFGQRQQPLSRPRARSIKRKPTETLFQQVLDLPFAGVKQGRRSEQTGLTIRFR